MKCPSCNIDLKNHNYSGLSIDVCEKCKGVWFDKNELTMLVKLFSSKPKPSEMKCETKEESSPKEESERMCPVCNRPMVKFKYGSTSDIILDKCLSCMGIWTDADEAFEIIDFIKNRRTLRRTDKIVGLKKGSASEVPKRLTDFFENTAFGVWGMKKRRPFW